MLTHRSTHTCTWEELQTKIEPVCKARQHTEFHQIHPIPLQRWWRESHRRGFAGFGHWVATLAASHPCCWQSLRSLDTQHDLSPCPVVYGYTCRWMLLRFVVYYNQPQNLGDSYPVVYSVNSNWCQLQFFLLQGEHAPRSPLTGNETNK